MKVLLIRHGMTEGNLKKRYIGATDEPLCAEGISQLENLSYPQCDMLFTSPMRRCIQTAAVLFPAQAPVMADDLRECDFGRFEGKNHIELTNDDDYKKWIESGGTLPFPDGEDPQEFKTRCINAFDKITKKYADKDSIAMVVHGGTIMSVLEKFAVPHKNFYDCHTENGRGWLCDYDGRTMTVLEKL